MKKVLLRIGLHASLLAIVFLVLSLVAIAQSPQPTSTAAPLLPGLTATAAPATSTGFFGFVKANLAAIALAVYAFLDVLILAIPSLAGNGLIHQIILTAGKLAGMTPPASTTAPPA